MPIPNCLLSIAADRHGLARQHRRQFMAREHEGIEGTGRCEKIDFAEISSEPKRMPKTQRLLIRHPGAILFKAEIAPRF
jgi:hypothetical protein